MLNKKKQAIGYCRIGPIWWILPSLIYRVCIEAVSTSSLNHTNNTLSMIVLIRYIPRVFLTLSQLTRIACAGAAYEWKFLAASSSLHVESEDVSLSESILSNTCSASYFEQNTCTTHVQRSNRDYPDQSTMVGSRDMVDLRNGVYLLKLGGVNGAEETRERSFAAGSDEELSVAPRQCDARHTRSRVCMSTCRSGRPERRPSPPSASRGLLIYLYLDDLSVHDCNPS
jgi:hypothetical protein